MYLAVSPDRSTYALKKIHALLESDDTVYTQAMREIAIHGEFSSPYIISVLSSLVEQNPDGSKDVYILLPYFTQSLHDVISQRVLAGEPFPRDEILRLTIGIARGLQVMHKHKGRPPHNEALTQPYPRGRNPSASQQGLLPEDQQELLPHNEDVELSLLTARPMAHRDLKPANVMLSLTGLPVLIDLGSTSEARVTPATPQQALEIQERASQESTIYYRAPELLEVTVGEPLTEKTDVWSLGCVVFAMMHGGLSPFEKMEMEQGGNVNMAISMGEVVFPRGDALDEALHELIRGCLAVADRERLSVDEVIQTCLEIQGM